MKSRARSAGVRAQNDIPKFRRVVWAHYKKSGRHDLPWRTNNDPYRILVSEVMLQQTQVDRVIPFYERFLKEFPTAADLARTPLSKVLKNWQGLGYNRRAKMLQQAAKDIVGRFENRFPQSVEEIESLSGVGPYTARAVAAFAFNQDVPVIETNVRTVIIHYFFPKKKKVSDTEIEKILIQALPKKRSREWYSALMDYGSYLKRSGISHNARTKQYTKQSKFSGSLREVRGAILRLLADGSATKKRIEGLFRVSRRTQILEALAALLVEGLVRVKGSTYSLAD
ncbi:MAG: A/G-specific adenine glycosylase [bacterium]|nr:A/G-specific adenine glycosylase [bacterium]